MQILYQLVVVLFLLLIFTATFTLTLAMVRRHRRRRQMRVHPIVLPSVMGLRVIPDGDARHPWRTDTGTGITGAPAGVMDSAMMRSRAAEIAAQQLRIAEMQLLDEEHALAHAVESSLSGRSGPAQRSAEERAMQQALEVRRHTARAFSASLTECWTALDGRIRS